MTFEFATATRIIFGEGSVNQIGVIAGQQGERALVVTGLEEGLTRPIFKVLNEANIKVEIYYLMGEPTINHVDEIKRLAIREKSNVIIGFGGGSSVDAAKATAALVTNPGDVIDYLEVIGGGRPIIQPSLPFIAVPTTAGTGAEVTRNAVLTSSEHRVKISLRNPALYAKAAIIDPELTYSLPASITACTGMDALTQVIEPFVSNRSNPLTDCLCREGMTRGARSLFKAFQNGSDRNARLDMSLTSLFGGLALANAGLGAVHGFAGPLGGLLGAPHGTVCAVLLPHVMEMNIKALQLRQPESQKLKRYDEIATILTGDYQASGMDGIVFIKNLVQQLGIPPLGVIGMSTKDIPVIVEQSSRASSMKGNPIVLTDEELAKVLYNAM